MSACLRKNCLVHEVRQLHHQLAVVEMRERHACSALATGTGRLDHDVDDVVDQVREKKPAKEARVGYAAVHDGQMRAVLGGRCCRYQPQDGAFPGRRRRMPATPAQAIGWFARMQVGCDATHVSVTASLTATTERPALRSIITRSYVDECRMFVTNTARRGSSAKVVLHAWALAALQADSALASLSVRGGTFVLCGATDMAGETVRRLSTCWFWVVLCCSCAVI